MNLFLIKKQQLLLKEYTDNFRLDESIGLDNHETPLDIVSPFITEWSVATNESITLPLVDNVKCVYNFSVDWGDGNISAITSYGDTDKTHLYEDSGIYRVTITGTCSGWSFQETAISASNIIKIISFGNKTSFTGFNYLTGAFYNCVNLDYICRESLPLYDSSLSDVNDIFNGCTKLTTIHPYIFKNLVTITSANNCFRNCSLFNYVPLRLFKFNTLLTSLEYAFSDCTAVTIIPDDLLQYNINLISIEGIFNNTNITELSNNLLYNNTALQNVNYFVQDTLLQTIPEYLFNNTVNLYTATGAFRNTAITEIPVGLFNDTIVLQNIDYIFENTNISAIPSNLFDSTISLVSLIGSFKNCSMLESIPEGLFYFISSTTISFNETFYGCIKLALNKYIFVFNDSEITTRFANTNVDFTNTFYRDTYTGIIGIAPELWLYTYLSVITTTCFAGSGNSGSSMSNYTDIDANWL